MSAAAVEVEERSADELGAELAAGRLSSAQLVAAYLERIERIDRSGAHLASVIEVNPEALALACAADAARATGEPCGPLAGLPLLLKDNIDSHDRMATTAGSLALVGARPGRDAALVTQLRRAGAILLGKTNMSEWANGRSLQSSSGWSGRGGLTRNPYALERSASGSSSGSAVAVAASLCAAAVGTETDGSILCPAAVCGIVGMKPTVGLISRRGIIPIAASLDTPGPMARSVRDCALLLTALAGEDPEDAATVGAAAARHDDYASALDAGALAGARLGVVRQLFALPDLVARAYLPVLAALEAAGAVLVDPVALPELEALQRAKRTVLLYEMKAGLDAHLRGLGAEAPVRSIEALIAFNERHAEREMPWFTQDILRMVQATGGLEQAEYRAALADCRRIARSEGIEAVLREQRLDALIAPTCGPAWKTDLLLGDRASASSTSPAAAAGTPAITVPAALWHGLPLGLSFFAEAWSEAKLLSLAYAFEQATRARRPPRYLPSVPEPA